MDILQSFPLKLYARLFRNDPQTVLFSATFPADVIDFAKKFSPEANMITLQTQELTVEGIKQLYLDCDNEAQKYDVLVKFYGLMTIASSIIFVRVSMYVQNK